MQVFRISQGESSDWLREFIWHYPHWPVSLMGLAWTCIQPVGHSIRKDAVSGTPPTCACQTSSFKILWLPGHFVLWFDELIHVVMKNMNLKSLLLVT